MRNEETYYHKIEARGGVTGLPSGVLPSDAVNKGQLDEALSGDFLPLDGGTLIGDLGVEEAILSIYNATNKISIDPASISYYAYGDLQSSMQFGNNTFNITTPSGLDFYGASFNIHAGAIVDNGLYARGGLTMGHPTIPPTIASRFDGTDGYSSVGFQFADGYGRSKVLDWYELQSPRLRWDGNDLAYVSDMSGYLPLTGGTLTGDLILGTNPDNNTGGGLIAKGASFTSGDASVTMLIESAGYSGIQFLAPNDPDGLVQIRRQPSNLGRGLVMYASDNPNNTNIGNTDWRRILVDGDVPTYEGINHWTGQNQYDQSLLLNYPAAIKWTSADGIPFEFGSPGNGNLLWLHMGSTLFSFSGDNGGQIGMWGGDGSRFLKSSDNNGTSYLPSSGGTITNGNGNTTTLDGQRISFSNGADITQANGGVISMNDQFGIFFSSQRNRFIFGQADYLGRFYSAVNMDLLTANRELQFPDASGTLTTEDMVTAIADNYLPLTGGTLTENASIKIVGDTWTNLATPRLLATNITDNTEHELTGGLNIFSSTNLSISATQNMGISAEQELFFNMGGTGSAVIIGNYNIPGALDRLALSSSSLEFVLQPATATPAQYELLARNASGVVQVLPYDYYLQTTGGTVTGNVNIVNGTTNYTYSDDATYLTSITPNVIAIALGDNKIVMNGGEKRFRFYAAGEGIKNINYGTPSIDAEINIDLPTVSGTLALHGNYVDLTTTQDIGGDKNFTENVFISNLSTKGLNVSHWVIPSNIAVKLNGTTGAYEVGWTFDNGEGTAKTLEWVTGANADRLTWGGLPLAYTSDLTGFVDVTTSQAIGGSKSFTNQVNTNGIGTSIGSIIGMEADTQISFRDTNNFAAGNIKISQYGLSTLTVNRQGYLDGSANGSIIFDGNDLHDAATNTFLKDIDVATGKTIGADTTGTAEGLILTDVTLTTRHRVILDNGVLTVGPAL